jgi:hypothetical protein
VLHLHNILYNVMPEDCHKIRDAFLANAPLPYDQLSPAVDKAVCTPDQREEEGEAFLEAAAAAAAAAPDEPV